MVFLINNLTRTSISSPVKYTLPASLFLASLFFFASLTAQPDDPCGTVIDLENAAQLQLLNRAWMEYQQNPQERSFTTIHMVPVQLHIIRKTSGADGISVADFEAALDRANELFLPAQIQFFQCAAINVIDDDTYSPYDYSEMNALNTAHSVANVINIYSSETVTSGASNICGHAQFPGGLDFVMLANGCTRNGSTFAHELGHYFNLYHTHETFFGTELVDGTNCLATGDLLCDTPADPTLSTASNVDANTCTYTGVSTDSNGDPYVPEVSNLMSYTGKHCRFAVSNDQYARMLFTLNNYRSYLTCASPVSLDAEFAADVTVDCSNSLTVQFCDLSEGDPTAWTWDFGDGLGTSTTQHPNYTYSSPGIYNVTLTASKGLSNDTETINQMIKVGAVSIPYSQNFESGSGALGAFAQTVAMKNAVSINATAANSGSFGLMMEGFALNESPTFQTPTSITAFDPMQNPYYKALLELCVDADDYQNLALSFDLRQMYRYNSGYTNFRVLVNGVQQGSIYQADGTETWSTVNLSLAAYDNTSFILALEASTKYDDAVGNATYIDNISLTGDITLPVEYGAFEVHQSQMDVVLDWSTLSENNNDRFEILRSTDQQNWEMIAKQAGSGHSQSLQRYQQVDFQAATLPAERLYYQLRQVDFDGRSHYSDVREVQLQSLARWMVFPNPSEGLFNFVLPNHETGNIRLLVANQMGQTVWQKQLPSSAGQANTRYALDLSHLAPGVYWLQVAANGEVNATKILVE